MSKDERGTGEGGFEGSCVHKADLTGANLPNAVGVGCQVTEKAESLEGATMPDGQTYEEWLKSKGRRENDGPS
jgi:hypothetical protein